MPVPVGATTRLRKWPALPLGAERLEDLHLERLRLHVDAQPIWRRDRARLVLGIQRGLQTVAVDPRVVGLELGLVPVLLERGPDPVDDPRVVDGRGSDIPLQPVEQRRVRQVRRSDIGRVEAGVALEEPGLRVQSRLGRLVRDLDLRPQAHELVQRPLLGRARVDAGDDAHLAAAEQELLELLADQPDACESHEGAQEVDPIGALDLEGKLRADLQIPVPVGQEDAVAKRDAGARPSLPVPPGHERRLDFQKDLSARVNHPVAFAVRRVSREDLQDTIGEVDLRSAAIGDRSRDATDPVTGTLVDVAREDVRKGRVVDRLPLDEPALPPGHVRSEPGAPQ